MQRNLEAVLRAAATALLVAVAAANSLPAQADEAPREIGGDLFLSGSSSAIDGARDVFAVGLSTSLSGTVAEDAHAVGFSVEVDADTSGDLYAAGGTVSVRGGVGSDLTATGATVRTHASSVTGDNARVTGGSVTIEGPVEGALVASAGELYLNAPIGGDAVLSGARIRFGPDAVVSGRLTYATGAPIDVPERVAAADRVTFERLDLKDWGPSGSEGRDWFERPEMEIGPAAALGALAATIGSFLLVGALALAFAPALVSRMRKGIVGRPGRSALAGVIGLAVLFGSVPILAMTIIGIPLVPIAVLAILIVWFLGYVLGAYSVGMGVARGLGIADDPSLGVRLLVLAATALVAALLNFIPVLGWMANFTLVILGVGAMTERLFERFLPDTTPEASVEA